MESDEADDGVNADAKAKARDAQRGVHQPIGFARICLRLRMRRLSMDS